MCQENDKSAPETLYHYCSPVGFERIITSRRIWLSNIFYMNDNLEHHWFRQKALRFIEASQLPQISIEDKVDIFELLSQDRPDDIFCLCLSEESDLLSQWRAYSDDGTGFAIGFNTNYFRYYTCRGHVGKAHVIYDDAAQERMLQGIFGRHNYEIGVGTTPLDAQRLIQIP